MADHIEGPLYYETMGKSGPIMAFVHPNPMDQSCWIFRMAQMSTWYRCIALDPVVTFPTPRIRTSQRVFTSWSCTVTQSWYTTKVRRVLRH